MGGDPQTLEKARKELEDLYLGVPDESVNLTFQDLAQVRHQTHAPEKKNTTAAAMAAISESSSTPPKGLAKLPSLDFTIGLQSITSHDSQNLSIGGSGGGQYNGHQYYDQPNNEDGNLGRIHHHVHGHGHGHNYNNIHHANSPHHHVINHVHANAIPPHHASTHIHHAAGAGHHGLNLHGSGDHGFRHHLHGVAADQRSAAFGDDMSHVSGGMSVAFGREERGGRRQRRPGIPHSNICTICCDYVYVFRHRCLVCGRMYCRQCVRMGMGDLSEGRKCIECLGRRFSQRYIRRAGNLGYCMGYPSRVRQEELKWAEKGPRGSGYADPSFMVSRSRNPITPTAPLSPINPPSFVAPSSPYSPASHHVLPL